MSLPKVLACTCRVRDMHPSHHSTKLGQGCFRVVHTLVSAYFSDDTGLSDRLILWYECWRSCRLASNRYTGAIASARSNWDKYRGLLDATHSDRTLL